MLQQWCFNAWQKAAKDEMQMQTGQNLKAVSFLNKMKIIDSSMYLRMHQAFGLINEVSRAREDAFRATNRENAMLSLS